MNHLREREREHVRRRWQPRWRPCPTSTCRCWSIRGSSRQNQANVYEFHLSGIIDMLGKLQNKKLDAELHDAQEDENNAALELVGTLSPDDVTGLQLELSTDTDWNGDACTTRSVSGMHLELVNPIFFNRVSWYTLVSYSWRRKQEDGFGSHSTGGARIHEANEGLLWSPGRSCPEGRRTGRIRSIPSLAAPVRATDNSNDSDEIGRVAVDAVRW